ncbi:hypothetical protein K439DRAFT_1619639 [Ramaria rubella]|nr:hypothetical protein K439DRAFT_1619639 [Ramaria rubella]
MAGYTLDMWNWKSLACIFLPKTIKNNYVGPPRPTNKHTHAVTTCYGHIVKSRTTLYSYNPGVPVFQLYRSDMCDLIAQTQIKLIGFSLSSFLLLVPKCPSLECVWTCSNVLMPSEGVESELGNLLSALTQQEIHTSRAEVIDASALARFPTLFPLNNPLGWVQLPQLQQWLVQHAHLSKSPPPSELRPPSPTIQCKSKNTPSKVLRPQPACQMCVKCWKPRQLLADLLQEVIVISSDSEDEPPQKKVKIKLASKIQNEPLILDESEDVFMEIAITRQLKVSKTEHLKAIPRCWPVWEQHTAFILDLSQDNQEWENSENELISMETVIREHDQDNWGGSGGHRTDESKCLHVTVLDNQWCQHIILKCQGCYTCSYLDPTLLQDCICREYDDDQMRNVWEAERKLNEQQGGTVQGITATFYNQIQKHVCSYNNIVCEGQPVLRKWKKHAQSLDGKAYFVGCSAWKRADPERMHQFLPIPYNVDEELLLKMIQKHSDLLDEEIANPTCALVILHHIGS